MEEVHALHRQLLGIAVLVLEQVLERVDVEERRNRYEAPSLAKIAPDQELVIDFLEILRRRLILLHDAPELPVRLAVRVDLRQEFRAVYVIAVGPDQPIDHRGSAQGMVHLQAEHADEYDQHE